MLRLYLVVISLLLAGNCAVRAQNQETAAIWAIDIFNQYRLEPNVVYKSDNNYQLKLDIYLPKGKRTARQPALIFIHGGGWGGGTKENYSLRVLPWMQMGWTVVNLEYRLTDAALAPAAVKDCRCALRWVLNNADKYNLDKKRIVVSGQSAGGHLALMTGMLTSRDGFDDECATGEEPKVAAVINWFGITDVKELLSGTNQKGFAVKWLGDQKNKEQIAARVSPINYIRADLPPVFTVHGDADPTVPYDQAVRFHRALDENRTVNRFITIPKGKHGDFSREESVKIYTAIKEFLKTNKVVE